METNRESTSPSRNSPVSESSTGAAATSDAASSSQNDARSGATSSLLREEQDSVSRFMKDVLDRVNTTFQLDQFITNPDIDLNFQPTPSENAEIERFTSGSVSRSDMANDELSAVADTPEGWLTPSISQIKPEPIDAPSTSKFPKSPECVVIDDSSDTESDFDTGLSDWQPIKTKLWHRNIDAENSDTSDSDTATPPPPEPLRLLEYDTFDTFDTSPKRLSPNVSDKQEKRPSKDRGKDNPRKSRAKNRSDSTKRGRDDKTIRKTRPAKRPRSNDESNSPVRARNIKKEREHGRPDATRQAGNDDSDRHGTGSRHPSVKEEKAVRARKIKRERLESAVDAESSSSSDNECSCSMCSGSSGSSSDSDDSDAGRGRPKSPVEPASGALSLSDDENATGAPCPTPVGKGRKHRAPGIASEKIRTLMISKKLVHEPPFQTKRGRVRLEHTDRIFRKTHRALEYKNLPFKCPSTVSVLENAMHYCRQLRVTTRMIMINFTRGSDIKAQIDRMRTHLGAIVNLTISAPFTMEHTYARPHKKETVNRVIEACNGTARDVWKLKERHTHSFSPRASDYRTMVVYAATPCDFMAALKICLAVSNKYPRQVCVRTCTVDGGCNPLPIYDTASEEYEACQFDVSSDEGCVSSATSARNAPGIENAADTAAAPEAGASTSASRGTDCSK
ncbi:GP122 [Caviid betaherpesvirus 2]|uniref:Immediate-early 2 n=2 Tax=Caviid betaherpesvirus 2 TaxID=33706 RepID=C6L6E4_9BETA|nr:GP122 [Caviid betaherpesvirus 2]AGE11582.1 GP122 [Caviid betaherpesvirus 2]AIL83970.1 GP122 [BAC cloning vector GPN13BACdenovo_preserved(MM)]BAH86631.1 immediate-early 2 [Caviid betaherpesvirus 2]BAJ78570.1 IE1/2 [Caviid betaherpesvirus 2]